MEELVKKFKKMTTAQLLVKRSKIKGEELEAVEKVLELRGQIIKKDEISEPEIVAPGEEEIFDHKISERTIYIEKPSLLSDEEKNILEKKINETEHKIIDSSPESIPSISFPEGFKKDDKVSFLPFRSKEKILGFIKSYSYDKQSKCFYFYIKAGEKFYYKKPESVELVK